MSAIDPKRTLLFLADESRKPLRRRYIQWLCNGAAAVAVAGRFIMLFVRLASVFAALLLASATVLAQGAKLTDPQIAHIAYTAGQLDIEAAQQALQKSNNKDVIAFAQDMERDHKAVNDQALALVRKLNVTPEDNDNQQNAHQTGDRKARRTRQAQRCGLR